MIWAKEETFTREQMEALQLQRLQETVKRVYDKVLPYREKMDKIGFPLFGNVVGCDCADRV